MKYLTVFIFLIAFQVTIPALSQTKKIPFVEHFSNTKCPICKKNRSNIETNLDKYKGDVNTMTIHRKYPYPECPLYLYAKAAADNRETVYSGSTQQLSGTPTLCVNSDPGHYNSLVDRINTALEDKDVKVGLNMTEKGKSSKEVSLEVTNLTSAPMDNLYVYAALVEKVVKINVDNENWTIHNVFRKFLGTQEGKGDVVGNLKSGESKTIKLEGDVPGDLEPSNLYVLAWVEQRKPNGDNYDLIMHNSVSVTTSTTTQSKLEIPVSELSIYPNPTRDVLHLRNTSNFSPHQYRILSGTGQEIKMMNASPTVDVSDLVPGLYYLILEDDDSRVSRQFVKQ